MAKKIDVSEWTCGLYFADNENGKGGHFGEVDLKNKTIVRDMSMPDEEYNRRMKILNANANRGRQELINRRCAEL